MQRVILHLAGAASLAMSFALGAAPIVGADKVQFENKHVLVWQGSASSAAESDVALPFGILVKTNGIYTVNGGKQRQLLEGEALGKDGMLIRPNGSTTPVMDHLTLNRGRVFMMRDGVFSELGAPIELADGTRIRPDGQITPRGQSPRRLLDGELFQIGGAPLPVRDTVTLKQGQVIVQKDGTAITVGRDRSIMMNDGTKVFGDGSVLTFSGERKQLAEGEVLVIPGVVTRPR